MPFISKDWRSPGEHWVKTDEGWEKKKVLECLSSININGDNRFHDVSCNDFNKKWLSKEVEGIEKSLLKDGVKTQPYCQITIKSTKEVAGFNALSDVLKRLDWRSAVRDRRRFRYITKLLSLLCSEKPLCHLPGGVQKVVFTMLEEVARQLCIRGENPNTLRSLDAQARSLVDCACWGQPLGSSQLWSDNLEVIRRVSTLANSFIISQGDCGLTLTEELPAEVVTEVVKRLDDPGDLESAVEVLRPYILSEEALWLALIRYHFNQEQVMSAPCTSDSRELFNFLKKKYGLREEYADTVRLCRDCRSLFWASSGHPCLPGRSRSLHVPVSPTAFLAFFSL
ncbi:unnamed protein product [Nezara viridula]|uniref:Uncharacterized protein n=1 Tax=Nezara viridula TaxID=85310 RepID=A0A9P0MPL3_NEZVI|nr:unnamed protein product [Nezara viridula]